MPLSRVLSGIFLLFVTGLVSSPHAETLLLQEPAISPQHIAFVYAGDIYVADHNGQNVKRLTSHPASESLPHFSPDGRWIAFTADYEANVDVYVIAVAGGQPKRLTFHPGSDYVTGWKGDKVLFTSRRQMGHGRSSQLFEVSINGGMPDRLMQAQVAEAATNGDTLAYRPYIAAHRGSSGWRNHRGGTTPPIWVMALGGDSYQEVPHVNATDTHPMWVGDAVYFLSDRDRTNNLYAWEKGRLKQLTRYKKWDIISADATKDKVIFNMAGALHLLNVDSNEVTKLTIDINPDLPQLRPQWKNAMSAMTGAVLSNTGKRALVSARGDIYSVPVSKGSTRNLTRSSGVNDRDGLWSPDGEEVVFITEVDGVQKLALADQYGNIKRTMKLADKDSDYHLLHWTPDGLRVVYYDVDMNLWAMTLRDGNVTKVDTNIRMDGFETATSYDGHWLAYTKGAYNYFTDIYLYNFASQQRIKLTDSMSDNQSPAFSRDGDYLFFASSTNAGPSSFSLDLSTQERPRRYGLYAAVLKPDGESPLLPETGDESAEVITVTDQEEESEDSDEQDITDGSEQQETAPVSLAGVGTRIVALPVPERAYSNLAVGEDNHLYFVEHSQPGVSIETSGRALRSAAIKRFNLDKRKVEKVMDKARAFTLSNDGKYMLMFMPGNKLKHAKLANTFKAKDLNTADVRAYVNPRQEWAQIFYSAWRNERDYFYDANMHGLDWQAVYQQFLPLLEHVGRREDLNWLMVQMIAQMEVGHNRVYGGDVHKEPKVPVGLLGADIALEDDHFVVQKVYTGEKWNPFIKAPLAAPGVSVRPGERILAVNDVPLTPEDNFYRHFIGTVGKQVRLSVAANGEAPRNIVVEPIASEYQLRHWHWIEQNRLLVDRLSGGRVGYVYLPNTAGAGYTYFNRMFFAQVDKVAMIIDERANGGGQAANYITDVLSREYLAGWKFRSGDMVMSTPGGGVYGPKVMLIDQDAGSGGDFLPYAFKRQGIGKLIGKTTWGGLIGISANRNFIDGGRVTVPHFRFFTPDFEWRVENEGVAPDIEVELDPVRANRGEDTQLKTAIDEVLSQLKGYQPVEHRKAPPLPTQLGT